VAGGPPPGVAPSALLLELLISEAGVLARISISACRDNSVGSNTRVTILGPSCPFPFALLFSELSTASASALSAASVSAAFLGYGAKGEGVI
jgi:hypothetical protein